ncbi:YbjQ family protein [Methylomonas sp. UP202]|uniref:YbjQ family protein n=1 Tax=Methylomonas sp. UP202 TaxID=3040943 RepID=UPI0024794EE9|nr:YbjQ family protein [Methylomonas sp. UP202]WGS88647.1 YbjQ family protein [Methylomonas sp. UP202]
MLVSTTPKLEGYTIDEYLGIVSSEAVLGANVFVDLFASWRNFFGGHTRGYEKELSKARQDALDGLVARAKTCGASGIVGVSIDHEFLAMGKGGLMMVVATGTAVIFHRSETNNKSKRYLIGEEA